MPIVKTDACQCNQCERIWIPRDGNLDPIACASCKSPYWNRPKKEKK